MHLTRQFKALARITIMFAGAWAGIAGVLAGLRYVTDQDGSLLRVATDMTMYGAVGAISGLVTALILARAEAGRQVEQLPTSRIATWGMIGGATPASLFGLLGLVFGAPADSYLPLMGLGIVSGGLGAVVAAAGSAAAKRGSLEAADTKPRLPAT